VLIKGVSIQKILLLTLWLGRMQAEHGCNGVLLKVKEGNYISV
jgi:hypothetical protein